MPLGVRIATYGCAAAGLWRALRLGFGDSRALRIGEPLTRPLSSLSSLLFPIPRRRTRSQGVDQSMRGRSHVVDGAVERGLVGARWTIRPTQLADELNG